MVKKRLINCDFLNASGFLSNLSNKAKLIYFMFLINADDKGFVGNAVDLANTLDQCEENFDNTLFNYKYIDALNELVEKRLVFEFTDKANNKVYLIRHWFMHNKKQDFLTTNYVSFLAKVELVDNKYQWKNHKEKNLKENKIKEKEIKENKIYEELESNNKEQESQEPSENTWENEWDNLVKELGKENN